MISVCIATYNGERFIARQLVSILKQLGSGDEVIVSDDGSTDNTLALINRLSDRRIRIINGPRRGVPALNFENALRAAKGDYIFLSDQDDVWFDRKVEICVEYLKRCYCVVSDAIVTDGNLRQTATSFFRLNNTKAGRWYNLLLKNGYLGCCMAFRKEVRDAALPFPPNTPMHDIWIGNVAAFIFNVEFIDKPLIYFRRHGHNNSTTAHKSSYSISEKIGFRLSVCKGLICLSLNRRKK